MIVIKAKTEQRNYPIIVGPRLAGHLTRLTRQFTGNGRLFAFYDARFYTLHGAGVARALGARKKSYHELVLPSGEKTKSSKQLNLMYDYLLDQKITRHDLIVACGGGVTSDILGYAAATTLRGIRWGVVPTTLLGMVDAAIGGKTAINHRQGKNLIGAFWQPSFVCADTTFLATLKPRHLVAGLGEIAKCAGTAGGELLIALESYLAGGQLWQPEMMSELIGLTAAYKANIVERDERESGVRAVLNFGHTFGHGLEKALGYGRLLHGEAVILGLLAALTLGERTGHNSAKLRAYRELVVQLAGLVPHRKIDAKSVMSAMALDKKRSATDDNYVLLKAIGRPIVVSGINRRTVRAALESMLNEYQLSGGRSANDFDR